MGLEPSHQPDRPLNGSIPSQEVADLHKEIEIYKQKVLEMSRLSDIGQLSAGILHEIKNPVSFVNNFSRLSKGLTEELLEIVEKPLAELSEDDIADQKDLIATLSANLTKINDNGRRIERIIQGMLAQTRSDAAIFESTDLNQMLEEFSKLAYQGVRGDDKEFNVSLEYVLDPQMGEVRIARAELSRVIVNMVNNACYAVNEMRKQSDASYKPVITVTSKKADGKVEIRISDNGIGIPPDIVERLFQPFFTTKPPGKGTGLGLSLTYSSIVETHKGTISVTSEQGVKTEFVITLPV